MTLTQTSAFTFRVKAIKAPTVTRNCEQVSFNFVESTLTLRVRQTMDPSSFEEAYSFARHPEFKVVALDDSVTGNFFEIGLLSPELINHSLESTPLGAVHVYTFRFTGVNAGEVAKIRPADHVPDVNFPTPVEALASIEPEVLELDEQQEMRTTPDNPDTDGDGVPDSIDAYPKDAKRR